MRPGRIIVWLVLALAGTAAAQTPVSPRYQTGAIYGVAGLRTPEKPYFDFNHQYGVILGTTGQWSLAASALYSTSYLDTTADERFTFFSAKDKGNRAFSSLRFGLDCTYRWLKRAAISPTTGIGLGYSFWKMFDPAGDTVVQTIGDKDDRVDFTAAEMYLAGSIGLDIKPARNFSIHLTGGADYLTGIGTAFSDSVNDHRGRLMMRAGITLAYLFGSKSPRAEEWDTVMPPPKPAPLKEKPKVKPDKSAMPPVERDSDGDGVVDRFDQCPNTPSGARVDAQGCATDSDGDGVLDGLDDCPDTPPQARGYIDIFGCPIDSDFDGVPDFRDSCRLGPIGAVVDAKGCPVDSDGDGISDGLDDCPGTEAGIPVDNRGCIDVAFLRDTMRIYVDYLAGSFELDERTKIRLQPLVKKLLILKDVTFQILGFTDNVGTPEANEALSQKRANRMRDWLEAQGVARERMTPIGRGEVNFISSNDTADGRTSNRRLELVFSKPNSTPDR